MKLHALLPLVLLPLVACQSGGSSGSAIDATGLVFAPADPAIRAPLWDKLSSLEGRWISTTPYGEGEHVFTVTSAGSIVREIMGPGTESEMTNMYSLSGNGVAMTHYCGAGNQPYMRAAGMEEDRMVFKSVSVGDLKDPGELYMGEMTLVFVDEDHVEQHWTSITDGVHAEMGAFTLERVK